VKTKFDGIGLGVSEGLGEGVRASVGEGVLRTIGLGVGDGEGDDSKGPNSMKRPPTRNITPSAAAAMRRSTER